MAVKPVEQRMMITSADVMALANVSSTTFARLKKDGLLPAHAALGGSHRWDRAEIIAWLRAKCPPRDQWEEMWQAMQAE